MPSLTITDYVSILNETELNKDNFDFFLETGTHVGGTVRNMVPHFKNIDSIELSKEYYDSNIPRFEDVDHVKLHLGDSSEVLDNIIGKFVGDTVFFLDGHWSGGDTAQGFKDCPLMEELGTIMVKFNHQALIIVDDYRMFGLKGNEDWTDITLDNVKNVVNERVSYIKSHNDRLVVVLKNK